MSSPVQHTSKEVHPTSQEQQKADISLEAAVAAQPKQGMEAQPELK